MESEIKVAVCDDDTMFLNIFQKKLENELNSSGVRYMIDTYDNGEELLASVDCYDAVFLDIDMPGMDGMEVAHHINEQNPIPVLFLTAYDDLVYSSIRFHPFRFIRKTCIDLELREAVQALSAYIQEQSVRHPVCFHTSNGNITISLKNITYVEIYGHWMKIYTDKEETIECNGNLTEFEKQWKQFGFARTHKSYLVNCRYIYSMHRTYVIMDNGLKIPLSRYREKTVREAFETVMRRI